MITIFHGDDASTSRTAFLTKINACPSSIQIEPKSVDLNQINNYLSTGSLFTETKTIIFNNFFSISKANLDKIIKLINNQNCDVIIWQDKTLNATQLKIFPQAKINYFKADNQLFICLNALKPHNLNQFIQLYETVIAKDLFDLFLYLLKGNLRRQLQTYTKFNESQVKKIYLQIIELEFLYKSGQLSLPKDLALKRVLVPILK